MRTALKTFGILSIVIGLPLSFYIAWTYGIYTSYSLSGEDIFVQGYHNTPAFYILLIGGWFFTAAISCGLFSIMKIYDRVMYMNQTIKESNVKPVE